MVIHMKLNYGNYRITLNNHESKKALELNQPTEYNISRFGDNLVKVTWKNYTVFYELKVVLRLLKQEKWILNWEWLY